MEGVFYRARTVGVSTRENYGNYTTYKPYFLAPTSYAELAKACAKTCSTNTKNVLVNATTFTQPRDVQAWLHPQLPNGNKRSKCNYGSAKYLC